ncbi:TPA: hypothetical protein ACFRHE_001214 [Neisseria lactamica]
MPSESRSDGILFVKNGWKNGDSLTILNCSPNIPAPAPLRADIKKNILGGQTIWNGRLTVITP